MNPKTGMFLFVMALLLALIAWTSNFIWIDAAWPETMFPLALQAMYVFGLLLMFQFSTLSGTSHWKWMLTGCILALSGSTFRIMHWPGNQLLTLTGLSLLALSYLHRFIKKKDKTGLDIFKVLWFSSICSSFILLLMGKSTDIPVLTVLQILFWMMFLWFLAAEFIPYLRKEASAHKK